MKKRVFPVLIIRYNGTTGRIPILRDMSILLPSNGKGTQLLDIGIINQI